MLHKVKLQELSSKLPMKALVNSNKTISKRSEDQAKQLEAEVEVEMPIKTTKLKVQPTEINSSQVINKLTAALMHHPSKINNKTPVEAASKRSKVRDNASEVTEPFYINMSDSQIHYMKTF